MTKWRNIHTVPREAAQYLSYAEITREGMTVQETTEGTSGSQAGHKTTAHQGKRGKPGNGRCEWEEWKPQVKQAGHMGCPSPKRVASAGTCLKTDWRERSGRDNLQGKTGTTMGQSEEKNWGGTRQRISKVENTAAEEKGSFGSPCSWTTGVTAIGKNYSKDSKLKCKQSTAWFVGSPSLKVFKNRLSKYDQKSLKGD